VAALAFDLDDTLFDRNLAMHSLLERWRGVPLSDEEWAVLRSLDEGGQSPRRDFFRELALRFPAVGKDGLEISRRFRHELPGHIAKDPLLIEALENLQSLGMPMAVLSNGSPAFQAAKLRACGAAPFFAKDRVLFSGSLGFAKPDPRAFAALAAQLGVPGGEVLFIGNDPERDIAGALAAGMQACLMQREGGAPAHPRIRHLGELINLLEKSYSAA
jgi:putative hydrolase of the HAD superfamily